MWGGSASSKVVAAAEPLRIEAFDTSLNGRRAALVGSPMMWLGVIGEVEAEHLYRGRTILVLQDTSGGRGPVTAPSILFRRRWDLIIRVKEGFEAQMVATYVANAPKPVRIVWITLGSSGGDIPRALWSRWTGRNDITLFGCHETALIGGCEWECILFPHGFGQERMEKVLMARGVVQALGKVRDGLSEITASGAALVWSNIDESDFRGGIYWYDPKPVTTGLEWSKDDLQDTLRTIADWVGRPGA